MLDFIAMQMRRVNREKGYSRNHELRDKVNIYSRTKYIEHLEKTESKELENCDKLFVYRITIAAD